MKYCDLFALWRLRRGCCKLVFLKRRSNKNAGSETISGVIGRNKVFGRAIRDRGGPIPRELWREIVGPKISERTRPLRLDKETLVVVTQSSSWAQELSLLSETILARLRAAGFDASALRFVTGKIEAARQPTKVLYRHVPGLTQLPAEINAALVRVQDAELRLAIAVAAARTLAFGKK